MTTGQLIMLLMEKVMTNPERANQEIFILEGYAEEWKPMTNEHIEFDMFTHDQRVGSSPESVVISGINNPNAFWALRVGRSNQ